MAHFARVSIAFFMFILTVFSVSGQTANFTVDYISGCAPLVVHFTNTSTGGASYNWNLGNGVTLTGVPFSTAPSTSYTSAGTYTVTLTAINGSSSNTHTLIITVYPTPTVSFIANDTAVCPGEPVVFTSTSSPGVTGPLAYTWNFGDGNSGIDSTTSHAFGSPGYYNITLSATNSQGCVSSLTKTAYIHVFTPAVISFTPSTNFLCKPPGTVSFTNGTTGTGPMNYTWSFGDGSSSTATAPSHTYTATGSYVVKLIVTDGNGCKDSSMTYVTVGYIAAAFTGPSTACVNSPVVFNNTSSTHTSSSWTFGDGGTSTSDTGIHSYSTAGTYTVTLVITEGSCSDTVKHIITILPGAAASFVISPANACPAPATATFTGTVPAGCSVAWKFGDGGTGSGATTTYTYNHSGVDTVLMIVTNSSGCKDTIKQVYSIYNLRIDINHDTIPSGCKPLTVFFTCHTWTTVPDSITFHPYPYGISSYTWNFGDGSSTVSGPGATAIHTYTAVGVYTCTVYIVTANGCLDTAHLMVLVGTPPVANFIAVPTHICAGQAVSFINESTGATNYTWYFGDSASSMVVDPTHIYGLPGTFTVTLIAYDNGCPDTFKRVDYIIVDSASATIVANYACNPRNEVYFWDSSLGDNSHLWIFGDGATSTASDTVHFYPALTTYTVTLATYNTASGCRDTARLVLNLAKPVITFTASDTAICRDGWVHFIPTITGDTVSAFYWYRDGILRDNDTGKNYTDTFHVNGWHTIMLVIRDSHNCMDTLKKTNYILVAKPVAAFTETPPSGCWQLAVNFTDHSTDVPGTTFANFAWTFGDGTGASVGTLTTSHLYDTSGAFAVTEIVTDNIGCKDTATNIVNVYHPHASFYATPTQPCAGAIVIFTNTSTAIESATWMFGDGTTSTAISPTHIYSVSGNYTITLVVTDAHGCTDTATYVNYVNITRPTAAFTASDTFSICSPLTVMFTNLSTGATGGYYWIFGDGNTSVTPSPSDLYITPGYYTVMLIATNSYGCKDTAIAHVNIYGYAGAFSYNPDTGCAPLTVYFHANITNVPSIIWDYGDGSTSSASSTTDTQHTYTIPGGYLPKLILSDNTGCQNSSVGIDTIKVDAVTTGFKTGPACVGKTVNFIDTSTSYWSKVTTWVWSFGSGATSTLNAPTYVYSLAGTYVVTLQATDAWGCMATTTEPVVIHPLPVITVSTDTTICTGDTATLTAYGGATYTWGPGGTLNCTNCNPVSATPSSVTNYTVTGTDINGCVNTDTVSVFLRTQTTSTAFGDTSICLGAKVPVYVTGATTYTWLPPTGISNNTIANPVVDPRVTTTYTVTAQLGNCAPDVNYVTVVVYPLPSVEAGPDQTLIAGSTAQLEATGSDIASYTWSPDETLSCNTCYNPVASMSVTTTYIVDVISPHNCKSSDSVTIYLYCNTSQVFVPNSFTPNGDGQNDVFYPRGTGISSIKSFRIYNRWGELLFERDNIMINDASNAWDGSYGGATPRPDVYVYVIDAICETGQPVFLKGDVTIIR